MRTALLLLSCVGAALGCSLLADAGKLSVGCRSDEKDCDGRCVQRSDPEYGCGDSACIPCVLRNATSTCDSKDVCAISACDPNTEDCDRDPENGCEVNLHTDVNHCGSCDAEPCQVPGAVAACARGECAIRKCSEGFKDCNRLSSDGCEMNIRESDDNCGGCSMACTVDSSCVDGGCE